MDGLKRWLDQQMADRLVEPTSSFGKALAYMQDHGETLTRFMAIEGASLDNNVVERALKWFIRHANSLFFATEHSAYLASVLTSLIATCLYAGVNALESLVALQEHRATVFVQSSGVVALDLSRASRPALAHAAPIGRHVGPIGVAIPQHNDQHTRG